MNLFDGETEAICGGLDRYFRRQTQRLLEVLARTAFVPTKPGSLGLRLLTYLDSASAVGLAAIPGRPTPPTSTDDGLPLACDVERLAPCAARSALIESATRTTTEKMSFAAIQDEVRP